MLHRIFPMASVVLGLLNAYLIFHKFGITIDTDAYNISCLIVATASALSIMGTDQFVSFYGEVRSSKGEVLARRFYHSALSCSFAFGLLFSLILVGASSVVANIYVRSANTALSNLVASNLLILAPIVLLFPINGVMKQRLNLDGKIIAPYAISIIPQVFIFILLVCSGLTSGLVINHLIIAQTSAAVFVCFVNCFCLRRIERGIIKPNLDSDVFNMVSNSIKIKLAGMIHYIGVGIITSNILSGSSPGSYTIYSYVEKIVNSLVSVSQGLYLTKLTSEVAGMYQRIRNCSTAWDAVQSYRGKSLGFYLAGSLVLLFTTPIAIDIYSQHTKIAADHMSFMIMLFVAIVWRGIVIYESFVVVALTALRKELIFYFANIIFVLNYYWLSGLTSGLLDFNLSVYAVLLAGIASQLVSATTFEIYCRRSIQFNG